MTQNLAIATQSHYSVRAYYPFCTRLILTHLMTPLTANQLRQRYIDFFVTRFGHAPIRSSSVIPENDPTVLFTTAGMHPLVPYLMGEPHPSGTRLVDAQKCIRTDDIDEVGDSSHCTFFEMMGNWSLGDYFKKEAIEMSYEFLTGSQEQLGLGLDPRRLCVTVFRGDADAPKDEESIGHWKTQFAKANMNITEGIPGEDEPTQEADGCRIFAYEKKKNWWGPAGQTGPCGPDTEMFYLVRPDLHHDIKFGERCHPNCDCGRFVEIWNDVFMQYQKTADGKFEPLKQQNVDTGLGLERVAGILQGKSSIYETEIFAGARATIEQQVEEAKHHGPSIERLHSDEQRTRAYRVILDHLRAATFMIGDPAGLAPSNTDQGYILRRLIRRAVRCGTQLGIQENFTALVADTYIDIYQDAYPELLANRDRIHKELDREETRFRETLVKGEKEFEKQIEPFINHPFFGENALTTVLAWFTIIRQALDSSDTDVVNILAFVSPKMKDIQMIIRRAGSNATIKPEEIPAKLSALFTSEELNILHAFATRLDTRNFQFSGKRAFYFYETFGFPKELIKEMLREHGLQLEEPSFDVAFKAHQELSRAGAEQKFSGGLADHSEECTMLHTATHLVHQALRDVLGTHVYQKGSNITRERMRFDFSHDKKMTPEELVTVEKMVNDVIARDLPVHFEILEVDEAKKRGAIGVFDDTYAALGNKVKVYFMGDYSKEVCGGPHVEHTGTLKSFKITKEEAVSDGVRRIKAVVGGLQQS